MIVAEHQQKIVQNEELGELERLDVLQLDQQLQEDLSNAQTSIEQKRPELSNVWKEHLVDQSIVQQFDQSLRPNRSPNRLESTIRARPLAGRGSNALLHALKSSTSPKRGAVRSNCLGITLFFIVQIK